MSLEPTDVVVVGAGPTGLACGIELKQRGLNVVLIDKGCVVNSIYHYPTNMVFFTTPELLEIGDIPMTSLNEKPVRGEALKYYRRVADHYELDIRQYQHVSHISGDDGAFVTHATDLNGCPLQYPSKKVILASGYYDVPNLLDVPGEDLPKVIHYYKEAHPYYNQDVIVVGAKNSAAIAALELHWNGARVTLVHRGDEISSRVKYWIKPNIENRIKSGEIQAFFRSSVVRIDKDSVTLSTPDGERVLKNDFVFAMIGYRPDTEFLGKHGIRFDDETRRPNMVPDTLESDRKGMYLAGVLVAGMHTNEIFIENGRFHGKTIAEAIARILKMITRRVFGKLAIAAFAKINSKIDGVTIGAQTYSFRDRSLDACIAGMKEVGLGEAELWQGHLEPKDPATLKAWRKNPPLDEFKQVRKKFDDAGIDLYAYNYSFKEDWTDEEIARGFDMAKALGVKYITASSNVSTAKRIDGPAQRNQIVVAFHNHSNMAPNEFARPEDFEEALRGRSKYLAINLDVGHFTAAGYDPVSFLEQHHDRIITVHIKDRKKNQGDNMPLGQGDTNIKGVLQLLKTKRYPIPANIEYEYKGGDTVEEVKKCFAYCKAALA